MVNPSEESQELVALALLERIAHSEGRPLRSKGARSAGQADREWILDTFYACLSPVRGHRAVAAVS